MNSSTPERLKKTYQTQIEKYGGIEGYRAEMRRRRSLVTMKTGFALMDSDKIKAAQRKSAEVRKQNATKNTTKAKNTAQENN